MEEDAERWLTIQDNPGRARNTILAYRCALDDHLGFCRSRC